LLKSKPQYTFEEFECRVWKRFTILSLLRLYMFWGTFLRFWSMLVFFVYTIWLTNDLFLLCLYSLTCC
jgi:hypothetical protein